MHSKADFVDADPATFYIDGVRYDDSYDLKTHSPL